MADKKSDVFNKPTAASTADAAKKEADRAETKQQTATEARADAAERNASFTRPKPLDIKDDRDADTTFKVDDGRVFIRTYPSGNVPSGQWGMAVWTRERKPEEYPAFLDNQGDWWWATTTNQNGVNPAVEKTEEPIGWRMF